jgi:hypothetical protein
MNTVIIHVAAKLQLLQRSIGSKARFKDTDEFGFGCGPLSPRGGVIEGTTQKREVEPCVAINDKRIDQEQHRALQVGNVSNLQIVDGTVCFERYQKL